MSPHDPPRPRDSSSTGVPLDRAELVVDLDAIRHNVRRLRELVTEGPGPGPGSGPAVMVVVKADGYGHGMTQVAKAAREAGADWIGVATLEEALRLRAGGDTGPALCWLAVPGEDFAPVIEAGVDVTAYSVAQLEEILAAVPAATTARVQLKVDTGLSRGGASRSDWQALLDAAAAAERAGTIRVTGVWSHLACADEPAHPANQAQERAFGEACDLAAAAGLTPEVRHLANSAGAILRPSARLDLVRLGIASYGLTPAPGEVGSDELGLVPAMTVRTRVAMVKEVQAGDGVSYGHTFVADRPMRVALVPLGYADGVPRAASSTGEVSVAGRRGRVLGRVCMDQVVVDAPDARAGDEVVLFGAGHEGGPTAQDWADAAGTISYEIVTRMGGRLLRRWTGEGS